jgi:hypothetical protein
MTVEQGFTRLVDQWIAEGSEIAPEHTIDRIAERIGREGQIPSWRAGLPMHWDTPARGTRVLLVATAIVAALGAIGLVGALSGQLFTTPTPMPPAPSRPLVVIPSQPARSVTPSPAPQQSPTASPSPSPIGPQRAALAAPLRFTLKPGWHVIEDSPNLLSLEYLPGIVRGPFRNDPPTLTIGVPYGYRNAAAYLAALRTLRYPPAADNMLVRDWCRGMAKPKRMTLAGLTGTGFVCDGDAAIDFRPLYPTTKAGRAAGVPHDREHTQGWVVLFKGNDGTSVVFDVDGTPVVVTLNGGRLYGPAAASYAIDPAAEARIRDLDLTFGR